MILLFYNMALLAALVVGAPWWLFRMATTQKYREGLRARLGKVKPLKGRRERPLIWIHAVSVGEVLAISRLVEMLDSDCNAVLAALMLVLTLVIVVVNAEMLDSCDRAAIAKLSPEPMPE